MGILGWIFTILGILGGIIFLIWFSTRGNQGNENIFDRGSNAVKNFKDCCLKKVNGLFGGNA